MAGPFPAGFGSRETERVISALIGVGLRCFVDLTEADERELRGGKLSAYWPTATRVGRERGVELTHFRFGIEDVSIPSFEQMDAILEQLDESLRAHRSVYVHCWGGAGRTGLVAATYLIRRGLASVEDFVDVIASRRKGWSPQHPSPQTEEQCDFVRSYAQRARL